MCDLVEDRMVSFFLGMGFLHGGKLPKCSISEDLKTSDGYGFPRCYDSAQPYGNHFSPDVEFCRPER